MSFHNMFYLARSRDITSGLLQWLRNRTWSLFKLCRCWSANFLLFLTEEQQASVPSLYAKLLRRYTECIYFISARKPHSRPSSQYVKLTFCSSTRHVISVMPVASEQQPKPKRQVWSATCLTKAYLPLQQVSACQTKALPTVWPARYRIRLIRNMTQNWRKSWWSGSSPSVALELAGLSQARLNSKTGSRMEVWVLKFQNEYRINIHAVTHEFRPSCSSVCSGAVWAH